MARCVGGHANRRGTGVWNVHAVTGWQESVRALPLIPPSVCRTHSRGAALQGIPCRPPPSLLCAFSNKFVSRVMEGSSPSKNTPREYRLLLPSPISHVKTLRQIEASTQCHASQLTPVQPQIWHRGVAVCGCGSTYPVPRLARDSTALRGDSQTNRSPPACSPVWVASLRRGVIWKHCTRVRDHEV